jgi:NAD(P)-dependent dehydrogenase (short-subunit alcohol dehydrogenase family)
LKDGRLKGKVAIVTGSASGIGAGTARVLAGAGAAVVVADIDIQKAERQAAAIRQSGGQARSVHADVADEASVRALVAETVDAFGGLDVVHNNAAATALGRAEAQLIEDARVEDWETTFRVNVIGTMLVTKHAIPRMLERGGGSIINMSSGAALHGDLGHVAYGASKAAVVAFTKYVATQYGKRGIRSNAIAPGMIITPDNKHIHGGATANLMIRHHLTPRLGRPDDIAQAVLFLASDDSAFITGQLISVDGGSSAHAPYYGDLLASGLVIGSPVEPVAQ